MTFAGLWEQPLPSPSKKTVRVDSTNAWVGPFAIERGLSNLTVRAAPSPPTDAFRPRYNVGRATTSRPGQDVAAVRAQDGERRLSMLAGD